MPIEGGGLNNPTITQQTSTQQTNGPSDSKEGVKGSGKSQSSNLSNPFAGCFKKVKNLSCSTLKKLTPSKENQKKFGEKLGTFLGKGLKTLGSLLVKAITLAGAAMAKGVEAIGIVNSTKNVLSPTSQNKPLESRKCQQTDLKQSPSKQSDTANTEQKETIKYKQLSQELKARLVESQNNNRELNRNLETMLKLNEI